MVIHSHLVQLTIPYHFSFITFGRFYKKHHAHHLCLRLKQWPTTFVCLLSWHTLACYRDIIVGIVLLWLILKIRTEWIKSFAMKYLAWNYCSEQNLLVQFFFCWFYCGTARPHQIIISPKVANLKLWYCDKNWTER